MSIAAMKLALDALNVATTPLAKDRQEVLRAQAALRQAIAEAETLQGATIVTTGIGIGKRAEEAYKTAEKHGWVGVSDERLMNEAWEPKDTAHRAGGLTMEQAQPVAINWDEVHEKLIEVWNREISADEGLDEIQDLIDATPPQRKPLPEYKIAKILETERMKWHKSPPTYEFDLAFARAIEAAHGITGETE